MRFIAGTATDRLADGGPSLGRTAAGMLPGVRGDVASERWAYAVSARPARHDTGGVNRFRIGVGRCRRVDAGCRVATPSRPASLCAPPPHLGPKARGLSHWLHYVLGMSFAKSARLLGYLGVPVTAGVL